MALSIRTYCIFSIVRQDFSNLTFPYSQVSRYSFRFSRNSSGERPSFLGSFLPFFLLRPTFSSLSSCLCRPLSLFLLYAAEFLFTSQLPSSAAFPLSALCGRIFVPFPAAFVGRFLPFFSMRPNFFSFSCCLRRPLSLFLLYAAEFFLLSQLLSSAAFSLSAL